MPVNPDVPASPELSLKVVTHVDAIVVVCSGMLTWEYTAKFKSEIKGLCRSSKRIVLDLSPIVYMDSSGIGAVVSVYVSAKKCRCHLRLANLNKHVRELLRITKLLPILGDTSPYPVESH